MTRQQTGTARSLSI